MCIYRKIQFMSFYKKAEYNETVLWIDKMIKSADGTNLIIGIHWGGRREQMYDYGREKIP